MAWETPKGYELCPNCSCDRPVRTEDGHNVLWQCKPGDDCKTEGCGCYLCVIAPGEKHLRIDGKPGSPGGSRIMPPGWAYVCACKAFPRRVSVFALTSHLSLSTLRNMQDYRPSTTVVHYSYSTFLTNPS